MSLPYNASQFVVGFKRWHNLDDYGKHNFRSPEEMAHATLAKIPSFVSIILKFDFLNAVLAKVDPGQSDQFEIETGRLDEIDYCDHDYYLEICSFTSSLNSAHLKGITQNEGFAPHRTKYGQPSPSFGASIALLDTGLSPHPFLPALSFRQAVEMPLTRHPTVQGAVVENFLSDLAAVESHFPDAYRDAQQHQSFASRVAVEVADFFQSEWKNWETQLLGWIGQPQGRSAPPLPRSRSVFGAFRIVSPQSWNFVDDSPNVMDYDGHGTGTAGCIAALPPLSHGILPEISPALSTSSILSRSFDIRSIHHLDYDVSGIAPYSELIVLKCLDSSQSDKSTLSTIIKALSYCLRIKPDCIYFGLALRNLAHQTPLMSLSRITAQISSAGIVMFAPAGNEKTVGLRVPAASPGVLPVTAIEWDNHQLNYVRAGYSSYADVQNQEHVEFCAYGGTEEEPIQVLSTDFGFTYDYGTSISAAVVAGIFANEVGNLYRKETERIFRTEIAVKSQVMPLTIKTAVESWVLDPTDVDSIKTAMRFNALPPPSPNPHPEFGYGLPRM